MKSVKMFVVLAAVLGLLLSPTLAKADEALIQTKAAAAFAAPGGADSAMISVVVTKNGFPVKNLGETVGDGTAPITLPAGWELATHIVPAGGSALVPTEFYNWGDGSYTIRVVPVVDTQWLAGDYHYIVGVAKQGPRVSGLRGKALGVLTVQ